MLYRSASLAAQILGRLSRADEEGLMKRMGDMDPELTEAISDLSFSYEDLGNIDDHSMQCIFKELNQDDLLISMKTASEALKQKFYSNMSERAATMIQEDFQELGPMKISHVEKAQLNIVQLAARLEEEGLFCLGRTNDDYV
jgi:flagellar motor switch protein FliG